MRFNWQSMILVGIAGALAGLAYAYFTGDKGMVIAIASFAAFGIVAYLGGNVASALLPDKVFGLEGFVDTSKWFAAE